MTFDEATGILRYEAQHNDDVAAGLPTTPRNGVSPKVFRPYLESLGWKWTPTMRIGSGCTVHLCDGELPTGRLIVRVSKHVCAVIDGVIYDTFDPQRGETVWYKPGCTDSRDAVVDRVQPDRCVYGYFTEG